MAFLQTGSCLGSLKLHTSSSPPTSTDPTQLVVFVPVNPGLCSDEPLCLEMVEDEEVPELVDSDQRDMAPFYHMYLIGKILGETIPIKFVMAKCIAE